MLENNITKLFPGPDADSKPASRVDMIMDFINAPRSRANVIMESINEQIVDAEDAKKEALLRGNHQEIIDIEEFLKDIPISQFLPVDVWPRQEEIRLGAVMYVLEGDYERVSEGRLMRLTREEILRRLPQKLEMDQ